MLQKHTVIQIFLMKLICMRFCDIYFFRIGTLKVVREAMLEIVNTEATLSHGLGDILQKIGIDCLTAQKENMEV